MKGILLFAFGLFLTPLTAQDLVAVSNAASYNEQVFYRLDDDAYTNVKNEDWDIAFSTIGLQDAGIHINEANRGGFSNPQAELEVYLVTTTDWNATIDPNTLTERLFNNEADWLYGGAFNNPRNPADFFDFGWGKYNPSTNQVTGDKIYVVKLRDGSWKKFQIQSVVIKTYTFRYANLDGSGTVTKTLNKDNAGGAPFMYFSFKTGDFLTTVQKQWDLFFSRYITVIYDNTGTPTNYAVVGTLSAPGVQVAEARGIDPSTVQYDSFKDSLKRAADIIGHDWKVFTNAWSVPADLAYFVKTLTGDIWKIRFISFGGATTGETIFEKTLVAPISGVEDFSGSVRSFHVFPNPATVQLNVVLEAANVVENAEFRLLDLSGKEIQSWQTNLFAGLNALELKGLSATPGLHILQIQDGRSTVSTAVFVN